MKTSAILLGMALIMGVGCENDDLKPIEKECFQTRKPVKEDLSEFNAKEGGKAAISIKEYLLI